MSLLPRRLPGSLLALATMACGQSGPTAQQSRAIPQDPPPAIAAPELPLVVFLGDSLTAGLNLPEDATFPVIVGERLQQAGLEVRVVNAGVSGDTSAGGLGRLDWLLQQQPDVVVVGLGANDGLRGQSPSDTEANLREIVRRCRAAGAKVLLLGMKIPPSYGLDYAAEFEAVYPRLATELDVPLVPFLLEDVAARPELNLADGIHPNAAGHRRIADTVLPFIEPMVLGEAGH